MALQEQLDITELVDVTSQQVTLDGGLPVDSGENPFEHEIFNDHFLIEKEGVHVGLENVIDDESEIEVLWDIYQDRFADLNESTLSRQSSTKEDFIEELADPSIIKYMARNVEGVPLGFMAVEKGLFRGNDLPYWPQQNDNILQTLQNDIDESAPSFYISTIAVADRSEFEAVKTGGVILQGALKHFRQVCESLDARSLCFFDVAPKNTWLPGYIQSCGEPDPSIGFEGAEVTIAPVYRAEWHQVDLEEESIIDLISTVPEDTWVNQEAIVVVDPSVPLEIQPEKLEKPESEYCYVENFSAMQNADSEAREKLLTDLRSSGKRYALIQIERLESVDGSELPEVHIGKKLSTQYFVDMRLMDYDSVVAQ